MQPNQAKLTDGFNRIEEARGGERDISGRTMTADVVRSRGEVGR